MLILRNASLSIVVWALLLFEAACGGPVSTVPSAPALRTTQPPNQVPAGPVAILVVDDFDRPKPSTEAPPLKENCTINPEGQGNYAGGGTALGGSSAPHGQLVLDELRAEITSTLGVATPSAIQPGTASWMGDIETWNTISGTIVLLPVDTERYTTASIRDHLTATATWLNQQNIKNVVVNMSFAIIPCYPLSSLKGDQFGNAVDSYRSLLTKYPDLQADFNSLDLSKPADSQNFFFSDSKFQPLRSKQDFVQATLAAAYIKLLAQGGLTKQDFTWTDGSMFGGEPDKLFAYTKDELARGRNVINVAAAGNSSVSFPFAPALWSNVISVSASDGKASAKANYSNDGEVMMDGSTFDGQNHGTSFAAPKLSLLAALYLLKGGEVNCQGNRHQTTSPPMKYANLTHTWINLLVKQAADDYCTQFPRHR